MIPANVRQRVGRGEQIWALDFDRTRAAEARAGASPAAGLIGCVGDASGHS